MTRLSSWDQWLALRRCHHHHLSNPRMSEHGGLSSKVKCQMLSIPTQREGPGTPSRARRPCLSAGDGKTPLLSSFCFAEQALSWVHHDDHITKSLFILYLTKGSSRINYHQYYCGERFCLHIQFCRVSLLGLVIYSEVCSIRKNSKCWFKIEVQ